MAGGDGQAAVFRAVPEAIQHAVNVTLHAERIAEIREEIQGKIQAVKSAVGEKIHRGGGGKFSLRVTGIGMETGRDNDGNFTAVHHRSTHGLTSFALLFIG